MHLPLLAEKSVGKFQDNYFTEKNIHQTGKRCAQRHEVRKMRDGDKLFGGMAMVGSIGKASVGMRMSNTLPINYMRMDKTSDTYRVAAKKHK
jgi:hypothetical protein